MDRSSWPHTSIAAKAQFDRLPKVLSGARGKLYYGGNDAAGETGPSAVADYGHVGSISALQAFIKHGKPTQPVGEVLSGYFGLVFACVPKTYRGTIPRLNRGVGPGTATRTGHPSWFSCHIAGAEGDDNFSGDAIGWISGNTAWQIVASNQKSVRVLVSALHRAAS